MVQLVLSKNLFDLLQLKIAVTVHFPLYHERSYLPIIILLWKNTDTSQIFQK